MALNPDDPLVETAVFGAQVEQFLDTSIGKYLMQRCDEFAQEAMNKLQDADPEDPKAIRQHQNAIRLADLIAAWLNEAIAMGIQAEQQLRTMQ